MEHPTPTYWATACTHLAARDAVLAAIMQQHPNTMARSRGAALETLQRAIVGQQISVKAADSVWARCLALVPHPNLPESWLAPTEEALRACGLSGNKVRYVRGIAKAFAENTIHPHRWPTMPDSAIQAELVALPGVGVWTAEMFLMFNLLRPDVLPLGDIGLINAFKKAYGENWKTPTDMKGWQKRITTHAAKHWAPYRSVATWYLWRSLDPVEVGY